MNNAFFGQYLLNRDIINAQQLAKTLTTHEVLNKKIGNLAIARNLLDEKQIKAILALQKKKIYFSEKAHKNLAI